jgi:hypothetical protein
VWPSPKPEIPADDIAAHKTHVTFFLNEYAKTKTTADLTASQLAERIRTEHGKAKKENLPWVKLARFGGKISDQKCIRWDENVIALTGCEIDYDAGKISFDTGVAVMRAAGIHAIGYTSASYIPGVKERWRFLVPFSKEYDAKDPKVKALLDEKVTNPEVQALKQFRAKMVARLNGMFDGVIANESFRLSLSYLYGAVKGKDAPSPQPRPAPTPRALPAKHADQRGPSWMPIRGPIPTPIDTCPSGSSWAALMSTPIRRIRPCGSRKGSHRAAVRSG